MRIAMYHNLHSGGAKRVVNEHLQHLPKHHDVTLFSPDTANHTFASVNQKIHVPTIQAHFKPYPWLRSPLGRLNTLVGMVNMARLDIISQKIARDIDQQHFDVVLAHPCQFSQSPLILRWLQTPTLYYCHELPRVLYEQPIERPYNQRQFRQHVIDRLDPLPGLCRTYYRFMDRSSAQKATHIAVNSQFSAKNITHAYGRSVEVCYLGIERRQSTPTIVERERFVLSVGALTAVKGFDFVIMALGTIPEEKRPPLVIISNYREEREFAYLQTLAQQHGVKIDCYTDISEQELENWYARAGCVAYAPVREPFGLVSLEAMAAGVPLVGVNEGGISETIRDGVSGILAARNPVIFGQQILRLLENPVFAQQLANTAQRYVTEHWPWEYHFERLEQLLEQTADQKAAVTSLKVL